MIGRKAFNQIDLAVSVIIIVLMTSLALLYITSFLKPQISEMKSSELESLANGLSDTVFGDLGVPENWQWCSNVVKPSLGSYIYRVPLYLEEYNGTDNNNVLAFAYLKTNEHAYNTTLVVYDGNETLPVELKNEVDADNDGFLEGVNVTFQVSVPANGNKTLYIYYSEDNETSTTYSTITPKNNTLNITIFSEERYIGLTVSKLNALQEIPLMDARDKFGIDYPFELKVKKTSGDWVYGYNLTGKEVSINKRVMLFQNSTGNIESVEVYTYVWR